MTFLIGITVYYYFKIWKSTELEEESILEIILDMLVKKVRVEDNRKEKTSFIIVDVQSCYTPIKLSSCKPKKMAKKI